MAQPTIMSFMNDAIDVKDKYDKALDKLIEKFTNELAELTNSDVTLICNAIKQAYRYG